MTPVCPLQVILRALIALYACLRLNPSLCSEHAREIAPPVVRAMQVRRSRRSRSSPTHA